MELRGIEPSAFAAGTVTTTSAVTVDAAFDGVIDLPALNSQFTDMKITVNDGTANWGAEDLAYWTSYANGVPTAGVQMKSGIWGDETLPGHGPLLLEGSQVGTVIFRVEGGTWQEVTPGTEIVVSSGKHVQVAYNDRPGSYGDNFGSLNLTVTRTKA